MQNKADVLNRTIETTRIEEASTLGAAMLAGIGVEIYKNASEAYQRVRRSSRLWEPDPRVAGRYAELFTIYRELAPALRTIHHEIGEIARR